MPGEFIHFSKLMSTISLSSGGSFLRNTLFTVPSLISFHNHHDHGHLVQWDALCLVMITKMSDDDDWNSPTPPHLLFALPPWAVGQWLGHPLHLGHNNDDHHHHLIIHLSLHCGNPRPNHQQDHKAGREDVKHCQRQIRRRILTLGMIIQNHKSKIQN